MHERQRKLLLDRRCAWCAETAHLGVLLRGKPCKHCGRTNPSADPEQLERVIATVKGKWKRRRVWAYGGLALATIITGWIPLVSSFAMVGVLIYLRVSLLRQPMAWFSPSRRFTAGFILKIWFLLIGLSAFAIAELSTFVPFASAPLKTGISLVSIALFAEVAVLYLGNRLRREASGDASLQWHEWFLPAGLVVTLGALGAACTAAVVAIAQLVG
jgi:hypothetical protein